MRVFFVVARHLDDFTIYPTIDQAPGPGKVCFNSANNILHTYKIVI